MDELLLYLETDIPEGVILSSLLLLSIAVVVILLVCKDFAKARKLVTFAMLVEYLSMILASTVVFRDAFEDYRYNLTPFYSYQVQDEPVSMFWQVVLNIVLFVPVGLMLRSLTDKCRKVVALGCLISMSIELYQLFFRKGLCETDDVIHNTIGALIGCLLYIIINKVVDGFKKRSELPCLL